MEFLFSDRNVYKQFNLISKIILFGGKMADAEITSMSSRGQVVIPQSIRNRMKLKEGERFVVMGNEETILLKKIEMPKMKNFDKLLKKTQDFVKVKGITEKDLEQAIKRVRS